MDKSTKHLPRESLGDSYNSVIEVSEYFLLPIPILLFMTIPDVNVPWNNSERNLPVHMMMGFAKSQASV